MARSDSPGRTHAQYPSDTPGTDADGTPIPVAVGNVVDDAVAWWENARDELALTFSRDPDSHTERDPYTFHPSQLAKCPRQAYIGKTGIGSGPPTAKTLPGQLIHAVLEAYVEAEFGGTSRGLIPEHPVQMDLGGGMELVGHADVYDADLGIIYDYKTRGDHYFGNFHFYEPPVARHVRQAILYMAATDATRAQVAAISKSDFGYQHVWPKEQEANREYLLESPGAVEWLVENRAKPIRDEIEAHGIAEEPEEIPFEKCDDDADCFMCDGEELTF